MKGKITIPVAIVLSAVILGISFFAIQYNKQQSIEKQQKLELEQEKKEYIAQRKLDCLSIYKTESDNWSNVINWRYIEPSDNIFDRYYADKCEISYKNKETDETFTKSF